LRQPKSPGGMADRLAGSTAGRGYGGAGGGLLFLLQQIMPQSSSGRAAVRVRQELRERRERLKAASGRSLFPESTNIHIKGKEKGALKGEAA
ncbi:MAG: hypothetical protein Q8938_18675, partial [Bacteroidota bacterium]|nr:hypothetical protein [Bacteroidota bacterium]